jgi:Flp pilus assembly protein TadG
MRRLREDGAVAVIVAIGATVLFMFGAFAVDLGAAYNERRGAQNSADAAALGGANALPDFGGSAADGIRDARSYLEANLTAPPEGWSVAWEDCVDSQTLAVTTATGGQCISVSQYGTRIRVVVPTRHVPTSLAAAMGISTIGVSAFAEAQIEYSFSANVLPFGIPPSAGAAGEVCLKTGAKGTAVLTETCDGSDQGNFGTLDFTHFGAASTGTVTQCVGQTTDRLTRNVILGVDHPLSSIDSRSGLLADLPACQQGADHGSRPNGAQTQTGGPDIQQSLIDGVTNDKNVHRDLTGRLAQFVSVAGWPMDSVQASHPSLDNQPLWNLIDASAAASAGLSTCDPTNIASTSVGTDTAAGRRAAMEDCLKAARSSTTAIFTVDSDRDGIPDISESHRFAFVPVVNREFARDLSGGITGTETVYFVQFVPVYLESVLWSQCQGHDYIFRPDPVDNLTRDGAPTAGSVSKTCKADALTALVLPPSSLPPWVIENGPGTEGTPQVVLNR